MVTHWGTCHCMQSKFWAPFFARDLVRARDANSHPLSLQCHNIPEQSKWNGRCWSGVDHKEILSRVHYISENTVSITFLQVFLSFYYSAVFSMTIWEAIWQLPYYNNSIHWPVVLWRWSQTTVSCWLGSNKISPWISEVEPGDCVSSFTFSISRYSLMHKKPKCGMQEYRIFLVRN